MLDSPIIISPRSHDADEMNEMIVVIMGDFVLQFFIDISERNDEEKGGREEVDGSKGVVSRSIAPELVIHSS